VDGLYTIKADLSDSVGISRTATLPIALDATGTDGVATVTALSADTGG